MSIDLISKIKPKNSGLFPVYDDIDGYGGFQVRTNTTDRDSIPSLNRKSGMIVHTTADGYFWELGSGLTNSDWFLSTISQSAVRIALTNLSDLPAINTLSLPDISMAHIDNLDDDFRLVKNPGSLVADGITVIASNDGNLWERLLSTSYRNSVQTDWYVDANNGNDGYTGTLGNPLQTIEELNRRLCPRNIPIFLQSNVNVHLAAGTYNEFRITVDQFSGFYVHVFGSYTSTSNITVSATNFSHTVPGTSTRGRITTSSGTFTNKKRVRVVSGSNPGAIAYFTALNSATDGYVTAWTDSTFSTVDISSGDIVAVDTLTSNILACNLTVESWDDGGGIWIQDCILSQGGACNGSSLRDGIFISGCEVASTLEGGWWGEMTFAQCRFTDFNSAGVVNFENGAPRIVGSVFQAPAIVAHRNVWAEIEGSVTSDTSSFILDDDGHAICNQSSVTDAWEFCNGSGISAAINVFQGCDFHALTGFRLWGPSGSNYTIGIKVQGGAAPCSYPSNALPSIPSTTNVQLANVSLTFAQLPQQSGSAILDSNVNNYMKNIVYLTGQTGTKADTVLFTAPPAGLYLVSGYLSITTAGSSGTISVNIKHTDDLGAKTQTATSSAITGTSSLPVGPFVVETNGTNNITYGASLSGTAGSLVYTLRVAGYRIG